MSADVDERIVKEFVAGADVPALAARYAVPEAYVDRVIEQASFTEPRRSPWTMDSIGNRALLAILVGLLSWLVFPINGLPLLVAVVFYILLTAIVSGRRR